ncbi:hypothetical protein ACFY5A_12845 [Microbacterium sp. NPDC012755]|uniref:hypothetical protein n=1 Tax=Microbacterium sp. NPDC012755 TaxID=3364184 RepID=UPI0036BE9F34
MAAIAPQAIAKNTRSLGSGSHLSIMRTTKNTIVSGMSARTSPMTDAQVPRNIAK